MADRRTKRAAKATARRAPGRRGDPGELMERIVAAARESFAANGWAGTTLRGVAREAGVDPALVHYYFDGKEHLLREAMTMPTVLVEGVAEAAGRPLEERGEACVRALIAAWSDPETRTALRSVILTAAHAPPALEVARNAFRGLVVGVVAESLPDDDRWIRAALVSSQMVGLAMLRYLWHVEPLASLPDEDLVRSVAPTIQRYLSGEVAVR